MGSGEGRLDTTQVASWLSQQPSDPKTRLSRSPEVACWDCGVPVVEGRPLAPSPSSSFHPLPQTQLCHTPARGHPVAPIKGLRSHQQFFQAPSDGGAEERGKDGEEKGKKDKTGAGAVRDTERPSPSHGP